MTPSAHGLGPTRARVLTLLQSNGAPMTATAVGEQLGLHKNSARFHLDALTDAGYTQRSTESSGRSGRPPLRYSATSDAPVMGYSHLLELTDVLLSQFVAPQPEAAARALEAGRAWGDRTIHEGERNVDSLSGELALRGFGVEKADASLRFTRCPFRASIPAEHLPLVCAMHQGFIDGYLSGTDSTPGTISVGPRECCVAISHDAAPAEHAAG